MSLLKKIQSHVKEYAKVIANIVECEVEIVDDKMIRIAGTGIFESLENQISQGAIYKHVLLEGKSHIIENPSNHYLCRECDIKDSCQEKLEISAPIFYKENAVEFMINMSDERGIITKNMLYENIVNNSGAIDHKDRKNGEDELITLEESEKNLIMKAISIYGNDTAGKNMCAKKLGIGIATLYRKLEKYNLK